jgi:glycosyltransferase involved in cell wall biosynthesis
MDSPIRVLMITSAWPTPGGPRTTHFIKRQADFLQAAGVDVDVFHFRGAKRPDNYARAWLEARRRMRTNRYDIVHAQFGQSGLLALPRRLPLVVTFRGSDLHGIVGDDGRYTLAGRMLRVLSRFVARHADAVVLVSEHMAQLVRRPMPVTVLPSGLDLELFRPTPKDEARRRLGLHPAKRLVLFAANPGQARKRFALAERAVDLLRRDGDVELVVAWGVRHEEMPLYMSACDAMVFTSMQEGSPNVVKEALACDLPVVSVDVGDVSLRLAGIEGCEVCPDDAPESIAAALERVLRRGARVDSRRTVLELDERRLTQRLIELYRDVIARRAPARARVGVAPLASPSLGGR